MPAPDRRCRVNRENKHTHTHKRNSVAKFCLVRFSHSLTRSLCHKQHLSIYGWRVRYSFREYEVCVLNINSIDAMHLRLRYDHLSLVPVRGSRTVTSVVVVVVVIAVSQWTYFSIVCSTKTLNGIDWLGFCLVDLNNAPTQLLNISMHVVRAMRREK